MDEDDDEDDDNDEESGAELTEFDGEDCAESWDNCRGDT